MRGNWEKGGGGDLEVPYRSLLRSLEIINCLIAINRSSLTGLITFLLCNSTATSQRSVYRKRIREEVLAA